MLICLTKKERCYIVFHKRNTIGDVNMDTVEMLMKFGLTRQESIIYKALLSSFSMTGYEIAKITGISRSNTYNSLSALVDKGAAVTIEEKATQYSPVPIDEFCKNNIRDLEQTSISLKKIFENLSFQPEGYITIKGVKHIIDKMINMIQGAQKRIYISVSSKVLEKVRESLAKVSEKGLKIVIISDKPCNIPDAKCYISQKEDFEIRLIIDSSTVLTGNIRYEENSTSLYSKNINLVDLIKESLKNEIKLIEISGGNKK